MGEPQLQDLAEDYLKSEDEPLKEKIDELETEIKELEEEEEKYQDLDDDLLQEVKDEKEQKRKEVEDLKNKLQSSRELEDKILEEVVDEFQLKDLNEKFIRSLNKIVLDEEKDFLRVRDNKISEETDLDVDSKEKRAIRHQIKRVARDILENDEKVEKTWEKIRSGSKYEPFEIIAEADQGISPDDVSDRLEVKRSTARGRMKNSRYQLPLNPYYVDSDGNYHLSILGSHLKDSRMDEESLNEEDDDGDPDEDDSNSKITQEKFRDKVAE